MRFLYFIIIIGIVLHGCTSKKGNNEKITISDSAEVIVNDTFKLVYDNHLKIPAQVYLDTIYKNDKHTKFKMTVITPQLNEKEFKKINDILLKQIKTKEQEYISSNIDGIIKEVTGVEIQIEPVSIYKDDKIISYAFAIYYSDAQLMRPFRTFFSVNYDLKKNKVLNLTDYFNIVTVTDSVFLSNMIYSAVDEKEGLGATGYNNDYVFAIDDNNVYFYFDQGGVGGNPVGIEGSAKKKYITNLIKDEYR